MLTSPLGGDIAKRMNVTFKISLEQRAKSAQRV